MKDAKTYLEKKQKHTSVGAVFAMRKKKGRVVLAQQVSYYCFHHDSNDSEVVARYLLDFQYDPARESEVRSRYDRLLEEQACVK